MPISNCISLGRAPWVRTASQSSSRLKPSQQTPQPCTHHPPGRPSCLSQHAPHWALGLSPSSSHWPCSTLKQTQETQLCTHRPPGRPSCLSRCPPRSACHLARISHWGTLGTPDRTRTHARTHTHKHAVKRTLGSIDQKYSGEGIRACS